jgi:NAD(P) transhydrogenase subunit beta
MEHILVVIYLISSVTFMLGLKMLSKPDTARNGNLIAAAGMVLAIFATIFLYKDGEGNHLHNLVWIFLALIIGTVIGWIMAKRVRMTAMPQMVSFFNGMGGACAAIISIIEYNHLNHVLATTTMTPEMSASYQGKILIILAGLIIGTVSFSGSIIAYGKLEGKIGDFSIKGQQVVNIGLIISDISIFSIVLSRCNQWHFLVLHYTLGFCHVRRIIRFSYWRSRYAGSDFFIKLIYRSCSSLWGLFV